MYRFLRIVGPLHVDEFVISVQLDEAAVNKFSHVSTGVQIKAVAAALELLIEKAGARGDIPALAAQMSAQFVGMALHAISNALPLPEGKLLPGE